MFHQAPLPPSGDGPRRGLSAMGALAFTLLLLGAATALALWDWRPIGYGLVAFLLLVVADAFLDQRRNRT